MKRFFKIKLGDLFISLCMRRKIFFMVTSLLLFIPSPGKAQDDITVEEVVEALVRLNNIENRVARVFRGLNDILAYGIAGSIPLHNTLGYSDEIHHGFSIFGIRFGLSAGTAASLALLRYDQLLEGYGFEKITEAIPFLRNDNNIAGLLITPIYITGRLRFNLKRLKKSKRYPLDLTVKYGSTELLRSSVNIEAEVNRFTSSLGFDLNRYRITMFGASLNFPFYKFKRNIFMSGSASYNYMEGDINFTIREDIIMRAFDSLEVGVEEDIEIANPTLTSINRFAVSSFDIRANMEFKVFFMHICMGIGLIVNSRHYYVSRSIGEILIEGQEWMREEVDSIPVSTVMPKFHWGIRFYLVEAFFYITLESFAFRFGVAI